MNRHEARYRSTGRALVVLLVVWVALMGIAYVALQRLPSPGLAFVVFVVIVPALFVAALVLGVVRIVSYIRWTEKYPYYFLFRKAADGRKE